MEIYFKHASSYSSLHSGLWWCVDDVGAGCVVVIWYGRWRDWPTTSEHLWICRPLPNVMWWVWFHSVSHFPWSSLSPSLPLPLASLWFTTCFVDMESESGLEKVQLLSEEEDNDQTTSAGDLADGGELDEEPASSVIADVQETPPVDFQLHHQGRWRRLASSCWGLRKTWFVMETFMLFKLAFPLVSVTPLHSAC